MARRLLESVVVRLLFAAVFALGVAGCGGDDGGPGGADASVTGTIQYMETCDITDDQCDRSVDPDLVCFNFNAKGPHCTHPCGGDGDCDAPSPGCNNMGVCKAPD